MTTPTKRPLPTPNFGAPPSQYDRLWFSSFLSLLTRRLSLTAGPNTIQPQILLQSPNGTVYALTVSDSGTVTTTVTTRGTIQAPV